MSWRSGCERSPRQTSHFWNKTSHFPPQSYNRPQGTNADSPLHLPPIARCTLHQLGILKFSNGLSCHCLAAYPILCAATFSASPFHVVCSSACLSRQLPLIICVPAEGFCLFPCLWVGSCEKVSHKMSCHPALTIRARNMCPSQPCFVPPQI